MSDKMEQIPTWATPIGRLQARLNKVRVAKESLEAEEAELLLKLHQAKEAADEWVRSMIRLATLMAESAAPGRFGGG